MVPVLVFCPVSVELPGLDEAVLARGAVEDQQNLLGGLRQLPIHNTADLIELIHQVLLVVEPSGAFALGREVK